MLGSKNRLKGLTLLLAAMMLLVLSGCKVDVPQVTTIKPIDIFSEKHYVYKDLDQNDEKALVNYTTSRDKTVAYAAGIILSRYYSENGDSVKALEHIEKYNDPSYLTRYMKNVAAIYSFDIFLKNMKYKETKETLEKMEAMKNDSEFNKVLIKYCNDEEIKGSLANLYQVCIADRYNAKFVNEAITEEKIEKKTKEEPEIIQDIAIDKEEVTIDVMNAFERPEAFQGMIYRISKDKLPIKLNTGEKVEKDEEDIIIDVSKLELSQKGKRISFKTDYNKMLELAYDSMKTKEYDIYVVLYPQSLSKKKVELASVFQDDTVYMLINYEMKSLQHELKVLQERSEEKKVGAVVLGEKDKHFYAVSLLKLYTVENEKEIIIATDSIGQEYFDDRYIEYFEDIEILSETPAETDSEMKDFVIDYKNNNGKEPGIDAIIGSDMIQYVNRYYFSLQTTTKRNYLSGIKEIDDIGVEREVFKYRINKRKKRAEVIVSE